MKPKEIQHIGGSWKNGGYAPTGTFTPKAGISAAVYSQGDNSDLRVLSVSDDNRLRVTTFTNKGWAGTKDLTSTITGSDVAAIVVAGTNTWTRAYYQAEGGKIAEYGSNDGQNWSLMQTSIPTSN
ncbi:hypothetical protein BZA77DRAFT_364369 [Pyronema omphalodes]|nr:hypothetical protein BZA77DRAFT_364369 [Pyronema omphalodes]